MENTETPSPFDMDEINNALPAGIKAKIKSDPVVAFLHTRRDCDDGKHQMVSIYSLTPDSLNGFNEILRIDEEILSITQAKEVGKMWSMYVSGPGVGRRETLGYEYPVGQSPINWQKRALKVCTMISTAFKIKEAAEAEGDESGEPLSEDTIKKISASMVDLSGGNMAQITDPDLLEKLSRAVESFISGSDTGTGGGQGKGKGKGKSEPANKAIVGERKRSGAGKTPGDSDRSYV